MSQFQTPTSESTVPYVTSLALFPLSIAGPHGPASPFLPPRLAPIFHPARHRLPLLVLSGKLHCSRHHASDCGLQSLPRINGNRPDNPYQPGNYPLELELPPSLRAHFSALCSRIMPSFQLFALHTRHTRTGHYLHFFAIYFWRQGWVGTHNGLVLNVSARAIYVADWSFFFSQLLSSTLSSSCCCPCALF